MCVDMCVQAMGVCHPPCSLPSGKGGLTFAQVAWGKVGVHNCATSRQSDGGS